MLRSDKTGVARSRGDRMGRGVSASRRTHCLPASRARDPRDTSDHDVAGTHGLPLRGLSVSIPAVIGIHSSGILIQSG